MIKNTNHEDLQACIIVDFQAMLDQYGTKNSMVKKKNVKITHQLIQN